MAVQCLSVLDFSKKRLKEQPKYEGFTTTQAKYSVSFSGIWGELGRSWSRKRSCAMAVFDAIGEHDGFDLPKSEALSVDRIRCDLEKLCGILFASLGTITVYPQEKEDDMRRVLSVITLAMVAMLAQCLIGCGCTVTIGDSGSNAKTPSATVNAGDAIDIDWHVFYTEWEDNKAKAEKDWEGKLVKSSGKVETINTG